MSDEKSVIDIDKTLALYGYIAVKKSDHAALTARAEAAEQKLSELQVLEKVVREMMDIAHFSLYWREKLDAALPEPQEVE